LDDISNSFTSVLTDNIYEGDKSRVERKVTKLLQLAILPDDSNEMSSPGLKFPSPRTYGSTNNDKKLNINDPHVSVNNDNENSHENSNEKYNDIKNNENKYNENKHNDNNKYSSQNYTNNKNTSEKSVVSIGRYGGNNKETFDIPPPQTVPTPKIPAEPTLQTPLKPTKHATDQLGGYMYKCIYIYINIYIYIYICI
jgi:hypothetical protein